MFIDRRVTVNKFNSVLSVHTSAFTRHDQYYRVSLLILRIKIEFPIFHIRFVDNVVNKRYNEHSKFIDSTSMIYMKYVSVPVLYIYIKKKKPLY